MSTFLAAVFWAVWLVGTLFCAWKALNALADRKREQRHDVGPDTLRLLQKLDAHLDEYADADPDLIEVFGSHAPDRDAGCDRLRNALRQHREEDGT